jgi:hypothetical protein
MKTFLTRVLVAGAAAVAVLDGGQAATWSFSFVGTDFPVAVNGSGILTTTDAGSPFTVTGATGTITDTSGTFTITGLSFYAGADNLLFSPPSAGTWYVDFGGVSFTTSGGPDFNIGGGGDYAPQHNLLNDSWQNPSGGANQGSPPGLTAGSYNIDLTVAQIPEPSTWAMLGLGFAALGLAALRHRKSPVSAFD